MKVKCLKNIFQKIDPETKKRKFISVETSDFYQKYSNHEILIEYLDAKRYTVFFDIDYIEGKSYNREQDVKNIKDILQVVEWFFEKTNIKTSISDLMRKCKITTANREEPKKGYKYSYHVFVREVYVKDLETIKNRLKYIKYKKNKTVDLPILNAFDESVYKPDDQLFSIVGFKCNKDKIPHRPINLLNKFKEIKIDENFDWNKYIIQIIERDGHEFKFEPKVKSDKDAKKLIENQDNSINKKNLNINLYDYNSIEYYLNLLSVSRVDDYHEWIRIGLALKETFGDQGFYLWNNWSSQSVKYDESKIRTQWNGLKPNGSINVSSIYYLAKTDGFSHIQKYILKKTSDLIEECVALKMPDGMCATLLKNLIGDEVFCIISGKTKTDWFYFDGIRWKKDNTEYVFSKISNHDFSKTATSLYGMFLEKLTNMSENLSKDTDDFGRNDKIDRIKMILNAAKCLLEYPKKERILNTYRSMVVSPERFEKLDSNPNMIGFDDGVYDLEKKIFRKSEPEDFISMSVCHNYMDKIHDEQTKRQEIDNFFSSVFPLEEEKEFMLDQLAQQLHGNVFENQRVIMATGVGGNGKSAMYRLLKYTLGDYYMQFPITRLVEKRSGAKSGDPELLEMKG